LWRLQRFHFADGRLKQVAGGGFAFGLQRLLGGQRSFACGLGFDFFLTSFRSERALIFMMAL
jgi:hypothetical protein